MTPPQIRVGIDWDNNGVVQWADTPLYNMLRDVAHIPVMLDSFGSGMTIGELTAKTEVSDSTRETGKYARFNVPLNVTVPRTQAPTANTEQVVRIGCEPITILDSLVYRPDVKSRYAYQRRTLVSFKIRASKNISGTLYSDIIGAADEATLDGLGLTRVVPSASFSGLISDQTINLTSTWQTVVASVDVGSPVTGSPVGGFILNLRLNTTGNYTIDVADVYVHSSADLVFSPAPAYTSSNAPVSKENLTPDTLDLTWRLGTKEADARVSADGSGLIVLDNSTGDYTAGNPNSFVGSVMRTGVLAIIEYLNDSAVWTPLFRGLVETIEYASGSLQEKRTRIGLVSPVHSYGQQTAKHPRMEARRRLKSYTNASEYLKDLLRANPANTLADTNTAIVDKARLDTATLSDIDPLLTVEGVTTLPSGGSSVLVAGQTAWETTSLTELLQGLTASANAYLFSRRDGGLRYVGSRAYRTDSVGAPLPKEINLNQMAQELEVTYGSDTIEEVSIDFLWANAVYAADLIPEKTDTATTVDEENTREGTWPTRTDVASNSTKNIRIKIDKIAIWDEGVVPPENYEEYEETPPNKEDLDNKKRFGGIEESLITFDYNWPKSSVWKVWGYPQNPPPLPVFPQVYGANTSIIEHSSAGLVPPSVFTIVDFVAIKPYVKLPRDKTLRLNLYNPYSGAAFNDLQIRPISVRGSVDVVRDMETHRVSNSDSPTRVVTINPAVIVHTKTLAERVGQFLLADNAAQRRTLKSMKVVIASELNSWYNTIMGLTLGDYVLATEEFTGLNDDRHIVIGEEFNYRNNVLTAQYTFAKAGDLTVATMTAQNWW